jgi:hypothetical protein
MEAWRDGGPKGGSARIRAGGRHLPQGSRLLGDWLERLDLAAEGPHRLSLPRRPAAPSRPEFLATDLVAAVHGGQDESTVGVGGRPALGASEPYFDEPARRQYAQRLRALRAVVEEAQALNDRERASRAQAEIDALTEELRRGLGLGGRVRPSGSPIERARVALTHAIKATLRAIAECDAELGHYLAATIKTGTYSSYSPDPRHAVAWAV